MKKEILTNKIEPEQLFKYLNNINTTNEIIFKTGFIKKPIDEFIEFVVSKNYFNGTAEVFEKLYNTNKGYKIELEITSKDHKKIIIPIPGYQ